MASVTGSRPPGIRNHWQSEERFDLQFLAEDTAALSVEMEFA